MERVYQVEGMSCEHCVRAVSQEVGGIGGVDGVDVDLPAQTVTVTGTGFTDDEVGAAVDEAGYQLVGAR
jgi:copper chaperone CopZ